MTNINEIMETYQGFVDDGILTLEAAQYMFDDHLNDLILETKKEIDEAFNEGLITAYEKNICYVNIGLDVDVNYDEVITNLIESELSYMEEKKVDPRNLPTEEEYMRKLHEKQQKKEKRKAFFKKVGGAALAAGAIAGGAYLANKAEIAGNDRKVVRADNPEYAEVFNKANKEKAALYKRYQANMKSAKTDIERDDLTKQYKKDVASINNKLSGEINNYKARKRELYNINKAKDQEAYDRAMANTSDPVKRADYERHHREAQDKWDIDKENRKKMEQFSRSDYMRRAELNREDPDNYSGPKKLWKKLKFKKKAQKINSRYDEYNKKNIN